MDVLKKLKEFNKKDYSIVVYLLITLAIFYFLKIKDITNYWIAIGILFLAYFFSRDSLHEYFIGINIIVITLYFVFSLILQSNPPIVAIVSCSMAHTNEKRIEDFHYKWLEKNLGYSRDFINSFPLSKGFLPGDVAIVKKENKYKIGDVIVFMKEGMAAPIIHRVIKINEDNSYQTKGDNNNAQLSYEKNIKENEIIGKVIFIIPKIGYIKLIFAKLFGIRGVQIVC
ncbi:MAG: signal peptidase I [Candidatus Aenigmarchaeota archaeon]|nr:signal peptidase I [Candidatus Aenigmarchaeota archaeon]MDW8149193.1 signal peptidase I [Candidatus Aenigmarchaeota archaeon]